MRELLSFLLLCCYLGFFVLNIAAAKGSWRPIVVLANASVFVLLCIVTWDQRKK